MLVRCEGPGRLNQVYCVCMVDCRREGDLLVCGLVWGFDFRLSVSVTLKAVQLCSQRSDRWSPGPTLPAALTFAGRMGSVLTCFCLRCWSGGQDSSV
jgi:hypothetical protein